MNKMNKRFYKLKGLGRYKNWMIKHFIRAVLIILMQFKSLLDFIGLKNIKDFRSMLFLNFINTL
jgi:hypothetical protein